MSEAATILGKPYYHVHRLIIKKQLSARKVGWAWLVKRSSVEKLKAKREKQSKKA